MPADSERNLSLQHLYAELARIDLLIRREVTRWQLAGQDAADAFRGLYVSDAEADQLLSRPFASSWGQTATLAATEDDRLRVMLAGLRGRIAALREEAARSGETLRLDHLRACFGLDAWETDALLICLAAHLDLRYERLYGYLQDDVTRKRPSVNLVLNLLCEGSDDRLARLACFADDAPLFRHHLLEKVNEPGAARPPLLNQTLAADESLVAWLLGGYARLAKLSSYLTLRRPQDAEGSLLVAGERVEQVVRGAREGALIALHGPDLAAQEAAVSVLGARLGRPVLTLDLAGALADEQDGPDVLRLALRDARLNEAVPHITGWDACLADAAPPPELMDQLCRHPDLCLVSSRGPWRPANLARDRQILWLSFPVPAYQQRRALWAHFVGRDTPVDEAALVALAGQFTLTTSQIRDAVASARDASAARGEPLARGDLFAAARAHSSPRLSSLARKITPRYDWADIILPADQISLLRELVSTVRGRPQVLEEWGVGRKLASSSGVTVLFAGPPGTGKTMAAEVIARELGLDLYKIDLSTVVSKYIGETEKNLERIFDEAETSNAILFFDEADSLFGKRSEVRDSHDRYANIEISYLLQRMEAYDGVTILATNLRANLDEAFTRRLQFAVDFPFPEEDYRLRIWKALFPPDVPCEPGLDFRLLARRFKLAGGNIRNVIVSAAYLAAADGGMVTMGHLLHGTRRELQKMGRLVNDEDMRLA